jgi:hypothetical protein
MPSALAQVSGNSDDSGSGRAAQYAGGGVVATAHSTYSVEGDRGVWVAAPAGGYSLKGTDGSTWALPEPVAISPHTCLPIFSTGGISLDNTFSEGSGDCTGGWWLPEFDSAPAPDDNARNRGPNLADLIRTAADRAIALAPDPALRVAPDGVGLTGLPSYFWLADPLTPINATARAGGLTVTATAHPTSYYWTFGDGSDLITHHSGRPFKNLDNPGDIDYTYETKGRYTLSVEVVWEASFRIGGGGSRPLGGFSTSASRPYPVQEVVTVLVPSEH